MININEIFPENVIGRFFVSEECISCDTCSGIAKEHFMLTKNNSHAFVYHQPETTDEIKLCSKALLACPVGAIGDLNDYKE